MSLSRLLPAVTSLQRDVLRSRSSDRDSGKLSVVLDLQRTAAHVGMWTETPPVSNMSG